jgi:hypothetical protein
VEEKKTYSDQGQDMDNAFELSIIDSGIETVMVTGTL